MTDTATATDFRLESPNMVMIPLSALSDPEDRLRGDNLGDIAGLAESIRQNGLLQPIVAHQQGEGFVIRAGRRRVAALRSLGAVIVPAILKEDGRRSQSLVDQIVENLQREGIPPSAEARAYTDLLDEKMTIPEIAHKVGRSAQTVEARIKLTMLPDQIQEAVDNSQISLGDALHLLRLNGPDQMLEVFAARGTAPIADLVREREKEARQEAAPRQPSEEDRELTDEDKDAAQKQKAFRRGLTKAEKERDKYLGPLVRSRVVRDRVLDYTARQLINSARGSAELLKAAEWAGVPRDEHGRYDYEGYFAKTADNLLRLAYGVMLAQPHIDLAEAKVPFEGNEVPMPRFLVEHLEAWTDYQPSEAEKQAVSYRVSRQVPQATPQESQDEPEPEPVPVEATPNPAFMSNQAPEA